MMVLDARKVPGSIVIGILVVTVIGLLTGDAKWGGGDWLPPSLAPTFFALDLAGGFELGLIIVILTFLFVDFFDTAGTLTSVANMAGKIDDDGKVDGIGRAVISDGAATTVGALLGTSSTTSYIESGAGIKEGGRHRADRDDHGRTVPAVFVPGAAGENYSGWATAPALVFVATFFAKNLKDLDWDDMTEYGPAILAAVIMPFTYSIANGIAIGFTAYVLVKALTRQSRRRASGGLALGPRQRAVFHQRLLTRQT